MKNKWFQVSYNEDASYAVVKAANEEEAITKFIEDRRTYEPEALKVMQTDARELDEPLRDLIKAFEYRYPDIWVIE